MLRGWLYQHGNDLRSEIREKNGDNERTEREEKCDERSHETEITR